jgi:hypothetical protein
MSDVKTVHLVGKFLAECNGRVPSEDDIVQHLLSAHPEYQRKELASVKSMVAKAVTKCQGKDKKADRCGATSYTKCA